MELPLLPLKTILFPGQALSLHIFEERYQLMVNDCLNNQKPLGMVLMRESEEVGKPAIPYNVGTLATITETNRQADGQFDILAVGQERFVIRAILQHEPYLVAHAEMFPPRGEDTPRAIALAYRVQEMLPQYVEALAKASGTLVQIFNVPQKPVDLAYMAALALQIPHKERQQVLEIEDVADMLAHEVKLLRRETALWRYITSSQERYHGNESPNIMSFN